MTGRLSRALDQSPLGASLFGRGQMVQRSSPRALLLSLIDTSSHVVRASKYRLSRSTECLYSTSLVSNAPLLAAGLVAVGGDGTWSNVANAILRSGADCRLALIAAGNGNDFAKTIGAPAGDVVATARFVAAGVDRRVDVGKIEDRFFINIAGFGLDVAVLEEVARVKWLRGDALYIYAALRQLGSCSSTAIGIRSPARERASEPHLMLVIANARFFGGAFRIAPSASITDGMLDAVAIRDASPFRRLRLFGAVIRGRHEAMPDVDIERSAAFTLRFLAPPAYETDGEYRRAASATIEVLCVPQALRVVVPHDAVVP